MTRKTGGKGVVPLLTAAVLAGTVAAGQVLAVTPLLAQTSRNGDVQLKAAQYKEEVEGDLRGAIAEYEKLVPGRDRALAAQALLRIAEIHQRLRTGEADAVYERLIQRFPEQTAAIAFARTKRAANAAPTAAASSRKQPAHPAVVASADRLKEVAVFDRRGTLLLRVSEPDPINLVSISPDGQRVAYSPGRNRIVILDVPSRTRTEVSGTGFSPAGWSPDGTRLTHLASGNGGYGIFTASSSGVGDADLLMPFSNGIYHWTADGRFVVAGLGNAFVAVPVALGDRTPIPFLSQVTASGPRVSPDSRFVAYTSNGVRESEIMVRPLMLPGAPAPAATGAERKVSSGGALGMARWRADGGELYYIAPDGSVMAAATSTAGGEFWSDAPVRLFRTPAAFPLNNIVGQRADVSANGDRFVFLLAAED